VGFGPVLGWLWAGFGAGFNFFKKQLIILDLLGWFFHIQIQNISTKLINLNTNSKYLYKKKIQIQITKYKSKTKTLQIQNIANLNTKNTNPKHYKYKSTLYRLSSVSPRNSFEILCIYCRTSTNWFFLNFQLPHVLQL
jgi:hypothetical protein